MDLHPAGTQEEGRLAGKVCVVTGAGRGIGAAIANKFAKEGAKLILTARSRDQLEEVSKQCSQIGAAECDAHSVDLSDGSAVDAFAKTVLEKYGVVNVLVNNAGVVSKKDDILKGDPDEWEFMAKVNLLAPMRLTHHFAAGMVERGHGTIINIASIAGVTPTGHAAYGATKGVPEEHHERMMDAEDVAQAALLPLIIGPHCNPMDITLATVQPVMGNI